MNGYSRFRLWRIDAARERLETATKQLVDPGLDRCARSRSAFGKRSGRSANPQ